MPSPLLSIVLPCYNEAQSLSRILADYDAARPKEMIIELILVDNGSTDETPMVLKNLLKEESYASFARSAAIAQNQGYGHGIHAGLSQACGRYLAWSHADMQCSPADVFAAFHKLLAEPNPAKTLVKGQRQNRPLRESLTTIGMQILARLILGQPLKDINGQPKVFHRDLLDHLTRPPKDFSYDLYVLSTALRLGWRLETVPVIFHKRLHGVSRWAYSLFSRWRHILATIIYMIKLALNDD